MTKLKKRFKTYLNAKMEGEDMNGTYDPVKILAWETTLNAMLAIQRKIMLDYIKYLAYHIAERI